MGAKTGVVFAPYMGSVDEAFKCWLKDHEKEVNKIIVKELKDDGMRCNCDLDKWEPEASTGHSAVCRIHTATKRIKENALLR
jgi:hypothetical protein